jgi:hypothetical protein
MILVYISFRLKSSLIFLDLLFKRGYPPTKVRGLALTLEDRQAGSGHGITSYVIDVKAKKYLGKYVDSKDLADKVIAGEKKGWKFNPATFRFSNGEQSVAPFDFRP